MADWANDEQHRQALLTVLEIGDPADPYYTADIPELEALCAITRVPLPLPPEVQP